MGRQATSRRRVKVSVTVDPKLLDQVDTFVAEHPGADRSAVFDQALALWYARRQAEAMAAQFAAERDPVERQEAAIWRRIRAAAATRQFGPR